MGSGPWTEYQFKVKPGDVTRRPPWISPYHHRLDWQMWIAFHGTIENSPWMLRFLLLLLQEDEEVLGLLKRKSASSSLNISNKKNISTISIRIQQVENIGSVIMLENSFQNKGFALRRHLQTFSIEVTDLISFYP